MGMAELANLFRQILKFFFASSDERQAGSFAGHG